MNCILDIDVFRSFILTNVAGINGQLKLADVIARLNDMHVLLLFK